jgi:superfamily II DNA or RNA helicase
MLEALMVERERHGRHRNLVVAATGTGKTVVAALDYRQLAERYGDLSLLFVAHREEILKQSLRTYRAVLRRGDFGEIHGAGRRAEGRHVFAMIQSLRESRIAEIEPDAFDVVVVDEFHHAAADSYDRLVSHLHPRELVGLTATPERLDGRDVTESFDYRIAVELRLWEAVDQGFLVPFQYFGVADGTDLRQLTWRRGGYAPDIGSASAPHPIIHLRRQADGGLFDRLADDFDDRWLQATPLTSREQLHAYFADAELNARTESGYTPDPQQAPAPTRSPEAQTMLTADAPRRWPRRPT